MLKTGFRILFFYIFYTVFSLVSNEGLTVSWLGFKTVEQFMSQICSTVDACIKG